MNDFPFKVKFYGGLGQIGSNMSLLELSGQRLLIDCGILFPDEDLFNIDYLIPNFDDLEKIDAIIYTHGHEDHIGATKHILEKFPQTPIYASRFCRNLILKKSNGQFRYNSADELRDKQELSFGDWTITPIKVNHSIPETFGLLIANKKLNMCAFWASDFKYDDNPFEGGAIDLKFLRRQTSDYKHRLAFLDSTNICSSKAKTYSEVDVEKNINELVALHKNQRIIATCFSSNVQRVRAFIKAAHANGKKPVLYGRSMHMYHQVAIESGVVSDEDKVWDIEEVDPASEKNLFLVSGSQGEFKSTMRRIANGDDSSIKLTPDDVIVFSSKAIPGNEKKIQKIKNAFSIFGCTIFDDSSDLIVHASGHPGKDDLRLIYDAIAPTDLIPIHGEVQFLKKHGEYFAEHYEGHVHILLNGDTVAFDDKVVTFREDEFSHPICIHGLGIPLERTPINERRKMAQNGLITISLSKKTYEISYLGLPEYIEKHKNDFEIQVRENMGRKGRSELIRTMGRRFWNQYLGYRPVVVVHDL